MPDIILKNILGQDVTYSGIDTVKLKNTAGGEETFSHGVAVEGIPIELDLANGGTQTITAPDGTLVKSAVVSITGGIGGKGVERTEEVNFKTLNGNITANTEDEMSSLLSDENNLGLTVKYTGTTGKYIPENIYKIVDYEDFNAEDCPATAVDVTSDTVLTSSLECNVGDLIIAAIMLRSPLVSLSEGWTLISTSKDVLEINPTGSTSQTLSFAYKYATNNTESITVTQTTAGRMYMNMVSFSGECEFVDKGYQYQNNAEKEDTTIVTCERPKGEIVLWGITKVMWGTKTWSVSNDARTIQLGGEKQSRLLLAIDTSNDEKVTFSSYATNTTDAYICGALSIVMKPHFIDVTENPVANKQFIEAEENTVMQKVVLNKPETLVPENILKGVEIAGVIGAVIGSVKPNIMMKRYTSDADITTTYSNVNLITSADMEAAGFAFPEDKTKCFILMFPTSFDECFTTTSRTYSTTSIVCGSSIIKKGSNRYFGRETTMYNSTSPTVTERYHSYNLTSTINGGLTYDTNLNAVRFVVSNGTGCLGKSYIVIAGYYE